MIIKEVTLKIDKSKETLSGFARAICKLTKQDLEILSKQCNAGKSKKEK